MVEGARLESVYTSNRIVGSNPTLSAIFKISPLSTSQQKSNIVEIWNEQNHWPKRNMKRVMRKHSLTLLKFWWLFFLSPRLFFQYFNMRYDKNGLPVKEYYMEELKKSSEEKMKALKYQKYYTGGAIVLMFLVLIGMYLILK